MNSTEITFIVGPLNYTPSTDNLKALSGRAGNIALLFGSGVDTSGLQVDVLRAPVIMLSGATKALNFQLHVLSGTADVLTWKPQIVDVIETPPDSQVLIGCLFQSLCDPGKAIRKISVGL